MPRCGSAQSVRRFQLGQQVELRRRERQHHPQRPRLGRHVVAHQERVQDRGVLFALDVLEEPVLAPHHLAVPHPQQHRHRVVAVPRKPDHVGVAAAQDLHRRGLLELLQPAQRVAMLAGALEVLPLRRDRHLLPHPEPDVLRPALQELEHLVDHPPIVFLGLPARRTAPCSARCDSRGRAGPGAPAECRRRSCAPCRCAARSPAPAAAARRP